MGIHTEDIAGALADIKEEGELCTFTLPSSVADTSKPWEDKSTNTDTTEDGYVAFVPVGRIGSESVIRSRGNEVPAGFVSGLVGNTPVLTLRHVCERTDGRRYAVRNIDELNVNGELILQTVLFQLLK